MFNLSDYNFTLPPALIAQKPCEERTGSRLLFLERKYNSCADLCFTHLADCLSPGDLLVFNNSKVMPARLLLKKSTGGAVEVFVERILNNGKKIRALARTKRPLSADALLYDQSGNAVLRFTGRKEQFFEFEFLLSEMSIANYLEKMGEVPLPPYIKRAVNSTDTNRYQTVYAKVLGSSAAPTAGLHFDLPFLNKLTEKGIQFAEVTLHVGSGTFQPVKTHDIREHSMHHEYIEINEATCKKIHATKKNGNRVIAVGTTAARSLESAALAKNQLHPCQKESNLFIYPGYDFQIIDGLITNFHLPQSSLLMMISAFAGFDFVKTAYQHAIKEKYRFFSYGDAMLIL